MTTTVASTGTGTVVDRVVPVPATGFQSGLWFVNQAHPDAPLYSLPLVLRLRGPVDPDGIRAALRHLVARHEILRLRFAADEDGLGLVPAAVLPQPRWVDLLHDPEPEQAWAELLRTELARPVDLAAAPGHRSLIAALGESDYAVVLVLHHACADARSMELLMEGFRAAYEAWALTGAVPAPPAALPYREVVRRLGETLDGPGRAAGLAYWRQETAGLEDFAPAADRRRPAVRSFATRELRVPLPAGLLERVDAACRGLRASRFMVFAAVLALALARWSGESRDPVLAVPQTLRRASWLDEVVAPLVNTVPLRLPVDFQGSFRDLVAGTRAQTARAMQHCGIAFDEIVALAERSADTAAAPLTSVAFHVAPTVSRRLRAGEVTIECFDLEPPAGDMDLVWDVLFTPEGGSLLAVRYATELFDPSTVDRMTAEYLALVDAVIAEPDLPLHQVEHRDDAQLALLWAAGDSAGRAAEAGDVGGLFAEVAAAHPDRVAMVLADRSWSYAELDAGSRQLAARLRRAGIRPGDLVALALPHRSDVVTAMLGVLRAGAAYLPLDLAQPAPRLRAVLARTRPVAVLTDGPHTWSAQTADLPVILLDGADPQAPADRSEPGPPEPPGPAALCYVMCTSGTTGEPKAVAVTHRGVSSLAHRPAFVPLGPGDTVLQLAPLSFDAATFEVWGALLNGATLVLAPRAQLTASEIGQLVREHRVTVLHLTAGLLRVVAETDLDCFTGLHTLLTGGDVVPVPQVRAVQRAHPGLTVVACYGPTENTTFSTVAVLTGPPTGAVPLGSPLAGRSVHLLDSRLRPVSPGAVGEVYVGGSGLARGYLSDPRQTAERFVPHPRPATPGERLYRTGDLARRGPDGAIEFLGRQDSQLKIRGFRVEPAEVEAALLTHPAVLRCLVRARGGAGERTLAAYVVLSAPGADMADVRAHVARLLPEPMVPSAWFSLDELPLTAQGKVDVRSLDQLEPEETEDGVAEEPMTPTQAAVHEIWCACLDRQRIGLTAGFFRVGGHSLAALRVAGRLERRFARPVPLAEVLNRPTIAALAAWLDAGRPEPAVAPVPRADQPARPIVPAQDLALASSDELAALLRLTGAGGPLTEGME
ncbi:non-ribosomal peptide synthetase [Kitasatospora mediocidica]|uniref:non-ribosomal peptide synthetase n=1 Tax=Kitasatospora mediocidica TaxID=58352 RepID=UPI0005640818|nr:non-ribosomal peptide synthetase [Kitasatospora mediocidica]